MGVRFLDEVEILQKRLEKYLERQKEFVENGANDAAFREYHIGFINTLASGDVLQSLKDNECGDAIKKVRLIAKDGELRLPSEMRFSNEYEPLCDFESFDKDGVYVSEIYCGIEGIKELFKELGVKDKFSKSDVALLANKGFCEYFWKKYLPLNESEWGEIKNCLNAGLPCVLDRAGVVRKPEELYHIDIEKYVLELPDTGSKLPMVDGIGKGRLSQLGMRTALSVEDSLEFLLADSECKMYDMRGRVLQWIADGCNAASKDLAVKYCSDERAIWLNGIVKRENVKEQLAHIKTLCAIRRSDRDGSSQARMFSRDKHVISLNGLGAEGEAKDFTWAGIEKALQWLGVKVLCNKSFDVLPGEPREDKSIKAEIKVRLLVFLAGRDETGWLSEYEEKVRLLELCKFFECKSIVVNCVENDWLRAEHGKFIDQGDGIFYVSSWQDKCVYIDIVKSIKRRLKLAQYSDDDLKVAFNMDGGDNEIVRLIKSNCAPLIEEECFLNALKSVSPNVLHLLQAPCTDYNKSIALSEPSGDECCRDVTDIDAEVVMEPAAADMGSNAERVLDVAGADGLRANVSCCMNAMKLFGGVEVDDDEYTQLSAIFAGGDTSDDAETQKRKDESKLACLRLFNQLEAQEMEPSMDGHRDREYVVRRLYDGLEKTGPNIDIKTGERLHVISAMGGVGYIPPRWWNKIVNRENGRNVICAVTGASRENCVLIRNEQDILRYVGDNAIPVKIRGANSEERVRITSDWFSFVDANTTAGKIYALLKLRE